MESDINALTIINQHKSKSYLFFQELVLSFKERGLCIFKRKVMAQGLGYLSSGQNVKGLY